MTEPTTTARLTFVEQLNAIKTWRYLRLAMVTLVVGLAISIGYEWSKTDPHCFQQSISAYYYTPVRGYLVGALVAIGVCLVSLKGNTEIEDVLLNLAGAFAPVVALVPTPHTGSCASLLGSRAGRDADIANNVFALLGVGLLGLVLAWALVRQADRTYRAPAPIGWLVALVVWLVAAWFFAFDRPRFVTSAHYTAAILMFVCIFVVVVSNARNTTSYGRWYGAVAWGMVASAVLAAVAALLGWDYWVLAIEVALITLFAAFWLVQTRELWNQGVRWSSDGAA